MLVGAALDILATRLRTISDLTVTTNPRATVVPPMAVVDDAEVDYNVTYERGSTDMAFTVTVYVSSADSESGHTEARGYLSGHGSTSVRAALDTPATDDLLSLVVVNTGRRDSDANYITAVFDGSVRVPGP